jgi:hypothetical protein
VAYRSLNAAQATSLELLCELIAPGSARAGSALYVDAVLARMPDAVRGGIVESITRLGELARGGAEGLASEAFTPDFLMLRALAIEAYYSDFVAPGHAGPGAWEEIDFRPPLATRLAKDWSYLGVVA